MTSPLSEWTKSSKEITLGIFKYPEFKRGQKAWKETPIANSRWKMSETLFGWEQIGRTRNFLRQLSHITQILLRIIHLLKFATFFKIKFNTLSGYILKYLKHKVNSNLIWSNQKWVTVTKTRYEEWGII